MALKVCSVLFVAYLATGVNSAAVTPSAPNNATVIRGGKQIPGPPSLPGLAVTKPLPSPPTNLIADVLKLICDVVKGALNCPCGDGVSVPPSDGSLVGALCYFLDSTICPDCQKGGQVQLPFGLGLEGIIQSVLQLVKNILGGIDPKQAASLENLLKEVNAHLIRIIKMLQNQPFPDSNTMLQPNMIPCPSPLFQ